MDIAFDYFDYVLSLIMTFIYAYIAVAVICGIVLPIILHNKAKEKGEISVGCAYLLLLCWGVFGAHRFYVNKTGSAVLWLFTGGFFGIGYIVDLFLIPSMVSDRNNQLLMYQNLRQPQQPVNVYVQNPNGQQVVQQPLQQQVIQQPQQAIPAQVQPVQQMQQAPPIQASRRAYLVGMAGEYAGVDMPLDSQGVIIGRDPNTAHLILNKEDCSRRHCLVSASGEAISIIDYSSNGTFLSSGRRLTQGVMTRLADGEGFYIVDRADAFRVELR